MRLQPPRDSQNLVNGARKACGTIMIVVALVLLPPRRSRGEESLDFKLMYYQEADDRIKVIAPTFKYRKDLPHELTIKIDGIYNSISGATPTGAPYVPGSVSPGARAPGTRRPAATRPPSPSPSDDDDHDDSDEGEDEHDYFAPRGSSRFNRPFQPKAGATPAPNPTPTPAPSSGGSGSGGGTARTPAPAAAAAPAGQLPMANDFSDERLGLNLELAKRLGRHTPAVLAAFSSESDYLSLSAALSDAIDFNKKNTTLLLGLGYTHDLIDPANGAPSETKDTLDAMVGVTQVLDPRTLFSAALTFSQVEGYLADPYKVVELNGQLVPERRPDNKDKQIAYLSLSRYFDAVRGAVEGSYRYYTDSFGIAAHTYSLAWHQKIGEQLILRPLVRLYNQSAADFYDVRFAGDPDYYSSDYRVSSLDAVGYDLKLIWQATPNFSVDIEYEFYRQQGADSITPDVVYPSANVVIVGLRWIF